MFAQLGDIEFELITYFSGLNESNTFNYAQHERINNKPILQYLGQDLQEQDIKLNFHASFCVPEDELKKLKNVKKHAAQSEKLGKCFVAALKETGLPVYKNGKMNVDLTQTSYSTIPTMDFELGNQCTATGMDSLEQRADAVVLAVKKFFM